MMMMSHGGVTFNIHVIINDFYRSHNTIIRISTTNLQYENSMCVCCSTYCLLVVSVLLHVQHSIIIEVYNYYVSTLYYYIHNFAVSFIKITKSVTLNISINRHTTLYIWKPSSFSYPQGDYYNWPISILESSSLTCYQQYTYFNCPVTGAI